ncbi:hypothetical protein [Streptomyces sp. NPDC102437]|uniref:hypothetical protein n=1 Tax=Streptomyces sp. NPDC102437 TaxID=3366175 RepID=UPI00381FDD8B
MDVRKTYSYWKGSTMSVSIERTTARAATAIWEASDDPQQYIAHAIDSGRLEAALAALGLKEYADLSALPAEQRAKLLRAASGLASELTRRVRHLTVAARDIDGTSWADLASLLVDDPGARSTARSTYEAGRRQMGRSWAWPNKPVPDFTDTELIEAIEHNETDPDPVTRDLVRSCSREWERRRGIAQ